MKIVQVYASITKRNWKNGLVEKNIRRQKWLEPIRVIETRDETEKSFANAFVLQKESPQALKDYAKKGSQQFSSFINFFILLIFYTIFLKQFLLNEFSLINSLIKIRIYRIANSGMME